MTLFHASRALTVRNAAIPEVAGAPALVPLKLQGREGVNNLFEYRLILQTPDAYNFKAGEGANFDLDAFIGLELTCGIELEGHGSFVPGMPGGMGANQGAGEREISGLITRARFVGVSSRHAFYEFTLRPWLHLATLTTDCRVYQDQSPVEIIEAVLARYAFAADRRLIETYPRRDYTVQYNEIDFEFVTRLMQEWGISYHFEHSGGVHRLVWSDHKGAFQPTGTGTGPRTSTSTGPGDSAGTGIGTNANAHHRIPFYPLGHKIDREYIHGFSPTDALTTRGSYGSRDYDYDYTRPRAILDVHAYVSQLIPPPSERRP